MNQAQTQENLPPKLARTVNGDVDINSLADLLEWFLNFDNRVALVRHWQVEELFQWKQEDDAAQGLEVYPFENAEARFAIGVFQALGENATENDLQKWITEVLQALGESKQTREDIGKEYALDMEKSHIAEAEKLPTETEKRLFLTSSWLEALCTAEVRFLGWVYQELYGKPFQPITD
ncbi:MAG TPA: hypothetical protein PKY59_05570 [Pyrinomonadaceae bacterium]|nr:hypothetical protein [Pyrinomonadaceae bacterium]